MTFPINTDLFVDGRAELFIQKGSQNFQAKQKRVKMLAPRPTRGANEKP